MCAVLLYAYCACAPLIDGIGQATPSAAGLPLMLSSQASYVILSQCSFKICILAFSLVFTTYLSNAVVSAKSPVYFRALVALKMFVSLISRLVACSPRIVLDKQTDRQTERQTDRQTHTQNDYCNPRCACTIMIRNAMYIRIPWNSSSTSIPQCACILNSKWISEWNSTHSNSTLGSGMGNGAPHLVWSSITTQLTPLQLHAWNSIHIVLTWGTWNSMFVIPRVDFLCLEFYSWRPVDKWNSRVEFHELNLQSTCPSGIPVL